MKGNEIKRIILSKYQNWMAVSTDTGYIYVINLKKEFSVPFEVSSKSSFFGFSANGNNLLYLSN